MLHVVCYNYRQFYTSAQILLISLIIKTHCQLKKIFFFRSTLVDMIIDKRTSRKAAKTQSKDHHIGSASHRLIIKSAHHHIITSAHHHIITSAHHYIITSAHQYPFALSTTFINGSPLLYLRTFSAIKLISLVCRIGA